jgi:hypothetical protein
MPRGLTVLAKAIGAVPNEANWLSRLLFYGPLVTTFAVTATVILAFYAEFFPVHASNAQPLAIEMRSRWRARLAKLNAILLAFAKFVFHFARAP